jgi:uncharacterized protein YgiM (DUF1202 family)
MKMTYWRILAISLSLAAPAVWADDQPPASTPGTDAKPAPRLIERPQSIVSPAPKTPSADPVSGPGPAVVRQNNVNVRGKAAINSEVITRLTRGQKVNVLEEVTLSKPKQDEPAKWLKISLPTNATVWAHASFIDSANNTVKPNRLNLRSGPGENYSVVGRIEKGTAIVPIEHKGEWVKLEPPPSAYGFVAAHLLAKEAAPAIVSATDPNVPPPIETAVPATATPAPATDPAVPPPATAATTPAPAVTDPAATPAITAPEPTPTAPPVPEEDPFVKRVVTREGIVERSVSIQAPSHFILQAIDTRRAINYLFSPSTNVMLKDFYGQRILVTGEELLDERWPNTPVINVDKIETVP